MRRWVRISTIFAALAIAACSSNFGDPVTPYEEPPIDPVPEGLLPASELSQGIGGWPEVQFDSEHYLSTVPILKTGDAAIDFTLEDVDGNSHRLADYLLEKPVLLLIGSFTCPVYHGKLAEICDMAATPYAGGGVLGDHVQFLHVYVMEAHPQAPDPSPHYGTVYEDEYSTVAQPMNYPLRVENALALLPEMDERQLLVVDDMRPHGPNNPVWSSYGAGANSAWLIRQDGTIVATHEWLDIRTMKKSINALLNTL